MKKYFPYVLVALIYFVPFRYAVLEPTSSNLVNLLSMVASILGLLVFMGLTMTDGDTAKK